MKTKKYYHVVFDGLNQLGADEMNEFYEPNYNQGKINSKFKEGNLKFLTSKRFRQINNFGPESHVKFYDLARADDKFNGYSYFGIKLKHMNYKVFEVTETYNEITIL